MKPSIFIQIASYRDPQLVPTVQNALLKSSKRNELIFGICHQHGDDDSELPFLGSSFRIDKVPYTESRGVCWARNRIQQMYDGETYTLHLDSHHRFAANWDQILIEMLASLKAEKPLLTGYLPAFDPNNDTHLIPTPCTLAIDRFGDGGVVTFLPCTADPPPERPEPARFYSGHFCFAPGSFAVEVQHDPEFYFIGEEISISVRAYTHGYDLFHPHQPVIWHEYSRQGRPKHWEDHLETNQLVNWWERDSRSKERNRLLLGMGSETHRTPALTKYGLGSIRSLRDYERYAGIHFASMSIEAHTKAGLPPPGPDTALSDEAWHHGLLKQHVVAARLNDDVIDRNATYQEWVVSLLDDGDAVIHKEIFNADQIQAILQDPNLGFEVVCFTRLQPGTVLVEPRESTGQTARSIALIIDR